MRLYIVRMVKEFDVIVAAENIAEAHKGHGTVGKCLEPSEPPKIKSAETYLGNEPVQELFWPGFEL